MTDDTSEFKGLYFKTSKKDILKAKGLLSKLQQNSEDKKAIASVLRIAHTLKGRSAVMGYKSISAKSASIENLFREIHEGKKKLTSSMLKNVSQSFDNLIASINKSASS